jgi:hypothetical protein
MIVFIVSFVACQNQQKTGPEKEKQTEMRQQTMGKIKIMFRSPIVMVNGQRAQKKEGEFKEGIELVYPENSVHNITLAILDSQGTEHQMPGKIEVKKRSMYTSEKEPVVVEPENADVAYGTMIRNGYGTILVVEEISHPEKGKIKGDTIVKLELGTKKKRTNEIEFRFGEGSVYNIQGKMPPVSFFYLPNSRHNLALTLEDGAVKVQGTLEVYQGNFYTELAPMTVHLDTKVKEYLREQGGYATLALYVPSPKSQQQDNIITSVSSSEKAERLAQEQGTVVALLKLRRVR